jgi:hypothetical protein
LWRYNFYTSEVNSHGDAAKVTRRQEEDMYPGRGEPVVTKRQVQHEIELVNKTIAF